MLSADDILNVRFTPTRFRPGYDMDQVDDFLDVAMKTVQELEARLAAAERRVAELSGETGR